jgi:hypothetical protein
MPVVLAQFSLYPVIMLDKEDEVGADVSVEKMQLKIGSVVVTRRRKH